MGTSRYRKCNFLPVLSATRVALTRDSHGIWWAYPRLTSCYPRTSVIRRICFEEKLPELQQKSSFIHPSGMKRLVPVLLFGVLAFVTSCSDNVDGYSTLNGTWTAETNAFVAEFTITKGKVRDSIVKLKTSMPGEFTEEVELTGGEISRGDDNQYLRYIQLGTSSYYLRILGLEINDSKTMLRGNSWFYYMPRDLNAENINEEFIVERK
jgi:hypothetical protein